MFMVNNPFQFKINSNTRVGSGPDNPFVLDFKSRAKPIYSNQELPVFSVQGGWGADNKWQNTGVTFDLAREDKSRYKRVKKVKNDKVDWFLKKEEPVGVLLKTGEGQAWMNKETLKKGTKTLLGMNEQVVTRDGYDYLVRGNNYANPWYPSDEKIKEAKKTKELREVLKKLPGVASDIIEQEKQEAGINPDGSSQGGSTSHPDAIDGRYAVAGSGRTQAKGARRARRINEFEANYIYQRGVMQANEILKELERPAIKPKYTRIGYGNRYTMGLTKDPIKVIEDYYEKTSLIDWAKGIRPDHAKLDPKRTVKVVDKTTAIQTANIWRHQGSVYHRGYTTRYEHTYKDVLASSRPKGDQMDLLYDKIMDKSKENKKKYTTYYKPDPEIETYGYYALTDKDFTSYEQYKSDLISNIKHRRQNQESIIDVVGSDVTSVSEKDRTKSLIPTLESVTKELDTKATSIKKDVDDYDWQKHISKSMFGTDTIKGDSHVGTVLASYDGTVRGGAYYSGDLGKLIKRTKSYEEGMKTDIDKKEKEIEGIELDDSDSLVEFYNEKQEKEYAKGSKDYLEKSLELTQQERKKLEQQKKEHDYYVLRGQDANISIQRRPQQSRGRPSLKSFSRQTGGGNKRIRSGNEFTLGGIVK